MALERFNSSSTDGTPAQRDREIASSAQGFGGPTTLEERRGGAPGLNAERGFTLAETCISVFLLGMAALGVAQLFALAIQANLSARGQTSTAVLAMQKMEQLRGLAWGYVENADGSLGAAISDVTTDLSVDPPTDNGNGLQESPGDTLNTNTAGYVDYLDKNGTWLGTGNDPVPGTEYIRRWSIESLPTNADSLVLQVIVTTLRRDVQKQAGAIGGKLRDDTRLVSVRTRRAL